jgi:hypothetical protein
MFKNKLISFHWNTQEFLIENHYTIKLVGIVNLKHDGRNSQNFLRQNRKIFITLRSFYEAILLKN